MQVSALLEVLKAYDPTDHLAVAWFDKFEFEMNLEEDLSDKNWAIICEEFEQDENLEQMNRDFLDSRCYHYQQNEPCTGCHKMACTCDDEQDEW